MPINDNIEAKREYQRKWIAKRRAEFFGDKTCAFCGDDSKLHLHHRDPSQKISHNIWSWSKERRLAEIAKCVVLCQPCHAAVHHAQHKGKLVHGETKTLYDNHGCRCEPCKKLKSERMAAYRKRLAQKVR